MRVCAVICEYNPFHLGHAYHLRAAREASGADYVLCLMSGALTQRGAFARHNKWLRARAALENGADLVLELPTRFACAPAPDFASGGVALLYILVALPLWFRRPNPVIFVPIDFVAIGLYLLYINFATGEHWFLSFAFPVTGAIGLLVTAMVTLLRYLPGGHLYVVGGGLILSGGIAVLIEFLINLTFQLHETFFWSLYPLTAGVILGGMLLVVAGCKPLRQSLHRKFFI